MTEYFTNIMLLLMNIPQARAQQHDYEVDTMRIKRSLAAGLFGQSGAILATLCSETSADIVMNNNESGDGDGRVICTISGRSAAVRHARRRVKETLELLQLAGGGGGGGSSVDFGGSGGASFGGDLHSARIPCPSCPFAGVTTSRLAICQRCKNRGRVLQQTSGTTPSRSTSSTPPRGGGRESRPVSSAQQQQQQVHMQQQQQRRQRQQQVQMQQMQQQQQLQQQQLLQQQQQRRQQIQQQQQQRRRLPPGVASLASAAPPPPIGRRGAGSREPHRGGGDATTTARVGGGGWEREMAREEEREKEAEVERRLKALERENAALRRDAATAARKAQLQTTGRFAQNAHSQSSGGSGGIDTSRDPAEGTDRVTGRSDSSRNWRKRSPKAAVPQPGRFHSEGAQRERSPHYHTEERSRVVCRSFSRTGTCRYVSSQSSSLSSLHSLSLSLSLTNLQLPLLSSSCRHRFGERCRNVHAAAVNSQQQQLRNQARREEQQRRNDRGSRSAGGTRACQFFVTNGWCRYGDECRFRHDDERAAETAHAAAASSAVVAATAAGEWCSTVFVCYQCILLIVSHMRFCNSISSRTS